MLIHAVNVRIFAPFSQSTQYLGLHSPGFGLANRKTCLVHVMFIWGAFCLLSWDNQPLTLVIYVIYRFVIGNNHRGTTDINLTKLPAEQILILYQTWIIHHNILWPQEKTPLSNSMTFQGFCNHRNFDSGLFGPSCLYKQTQLHISIDIQGFEKL